MNYGGTAGSHQRTRANRVLICSVFEEKHESGESHYHFPILAEEPWGWGALARELRKLSIYVGFSDEHTYYWTGFVYGCVPDASPGGKTAEDLDPDPWLSPGHLCVRETLEDMPRGARASDKARVRRFLSLDNGEQQGSKDVSLTDKEFAAHIVRLGLRTRRLVLAWVASRVDDRGKPLVALPIDDRLLVVAPCAWRVAWIAQGDVKVQTLIAACEHF